MNKSLPKVLIYLSTTIVSIVVSYFTTKYTIQYERKVSIADNFFSTISPMLSNANYQCKTIFFSLQSHNGDLRYHYDLLAQELNDETKSMEYFVYQTNGYDTKAVTETNVLVNQYRECTTNVSEQLYSTARLLSDTKRHEGLADENRKSRTTHQPISGELEVIEKLDNLQVILNDINLSDREKSEAIINLYRQKHNFYFQRMLREFNSDRDWFVQSMLGFERKAKKIDPQSEAKKI